MKTFLKIATITGEVILIFLISILIATLMSCEKSEIQMMEVKRESVQDTTGTTPTIEDFGKGTDHNGWGEL